MATPPDFFDLENAQEWHTLPKCASSKKQNPIHSWTPKRASKKKQQSVHSWTPKQKPTPKHASKKKKKPFHLWAPKTSLESQLFGTSDKPPKDDVLSKDIFKQAGRISNRSNKDAKAPQRSVAAKAPKNKVSFEEPEELEGKDEEHKDHRRRHASETASEFKKRTQRRKDIIDENDKKDIKIRKEIEKLYGKDFANAIPHQIKIVKKIGLETDTSNSIYSGRLSPGVRRVVKIARANKTEAQFESVMQVLFSRAGLSPRLYQFKTVYSNYSFFIMGEIDGTLLSYLEDPRSERELSHIVDEIEHLIKRMCKAGLSHNDLHFGNISIEEMIFGSPSDHVIKPGLGVIDFGYATFLKNDDDCQYQSSMAQLYRSLLVMKNIHHSNKEYLADVFIKMYEKLSGDSIPTIMKETENADRRIEVLEEHFAPYKNDVRLTHFEKEIFLKKYGDICKHAQDCSYS